MSVAQSSLTGSQTKKGGSKFELGAKRLPVAPCLEGVLTAVKMKKGGPTFGILLGFAMPVVRVPQGGIFRV